MARQLLIYESVVPLSPVRHAGHSVEAGRSFAFSAGINAVPLTAGEIPQAAREYAVIFTTAGDVPMPAVVLGVQGAQNLYLGPDGGWRARYVPAFLRRHPFVLATGSDERTLTVCIDEACPGLNTQGRGERLFTFDGTPTPYVQRVLDFLKACQLQFQQTQAFGRQLKALDLLEPMQAQVSTPAGDRLSLSGFQVVSRDRLRALDPAQIAALVQTDALELLYLHLHSLRHFVDVKNRLAEGLAAVDQQAA